MLRPCTEPESATFTVIVEDQPVAVQADETVAGVLLRVFGSDYRTHTIGDQARAPYCLMGVCFECLAEVDGVPNRQGCLVPVSEGMRIARQRGPAKVA